SPLHSFFIQSSATHQYLPSFPTRRSSDLIAHGLAAARLRQLSRSADHRACAASIAQRRSFRRTGGHCTGSCPGGAAAEHASPSRSEEHTSELQSLRHLVCRLLLEKKKKKR